MSSYGRRLVVSPCRCQMFLFPSDSCVFVGGAPSLSRGRICCLQLLLAKSLSDYDFAEITAIFYCLPFEISPSWRAKSRIYYNSKEQSGIDMATGSRLPFRRLLRLAGPPHGLTIRHSAVFKLKAFLRNKQLTAQSLMAWEGNVSDLVRASLASYVDYHK
jgi:hypothetical protein